MVERVDGLGCKDGRSLMDSGRTVLLRRQGRIGTARWAISVVHPLRCDSPPWSACGIFAAYGRYGTIYLRTLGRQQNYVARKGLKLLPIPIDQETLAEVTWLAAI